jgi:hypothetical protein
MANPGRGGRVRLRLPGAAKAAIGFAALRAQLKPRPFKAKVERCKAKSQLARKAKSRLVFLDKVLCTPCFFRNAGRNVVGAHIRLQRLWNSNAAIGLLIVLHDGDPCASYR